MSGQNVVAVTQETVTLAMIAATICCVVVKYISARAFELAGIGMYALFAVGGVVVVGCVVPLLTATWLGTPLEEMMECISLHARLCGPHDTDTGRRHSTPSAHTNTHVVMGTQKQHTDMRVEHSCDPQHTDTCVESRKFNKRRC